MVQGPRPSLVSTLRGVLPSRIRPGFRRSVVRRGALLALVAWAASAPGPALANHPEVEAESASGAAAMADRDRLRTLLPLPSAATPADDPALVALGRRLFFDTRLSRDGVSSCASCHDLTGGGDDGLQVPVAADGVPRFFNTPTVFNTAFAARLGWRGDFVSLEAQVTHAVPAELLADWAEVTQRLAADPATAARFHDGQVTPQAAQAALAAYLRALVTPDAPFDRWMRGEADAMTPAQQRGLTLFESYGCAACHNGRGVGGTMFQRVGLFRPFFPRHRSNERADLGRYALTGHDEDRHSFKVPSLRNVALTAPYLHDGSVATLEGAVRVMAYYQVGRSLSDGDVADIVAFLGSLTGTVPAIAAPPGEREGS